MRLSHYPTSIAVLAGILLTASPALAEPDPTRAMSQQAAQQISAILQEKSSWTPVQRKVAAKLLLAAKKKGGAPVAAGVPELRSSIVLDSGNKVLVDIKADVTDGLLDGIKALGGDVISSFPQYNAVRARIPITQVETLAAASAVRSIRPADIALTNKSNTSQGDVAHRADDARASFGIDGTGVKVGVLSDSIEYLAALQAWGDLPPTVTVLPGQAGSGSSEGTAMMEIIYDLAPGADLYFATAFGGQASFASNILALEAAGCKVIVDDVFYFAEPAFEEGPIALAINTVGSGVLYFSAAGNDGNKNDGTSGVWEGDFVPTTAPPALGNPEVHCFGGGANSDQIADGSSVAYTLQWTDPTGGSANDYDLVLMDSALTRVIDASMNSQDGSQDPYEEIESKGWDDVGRRLVIVKNAGAADRYLRLHAIRGRLAISTAGNSWGHSATDNAISVAAVDVSTAGGEHFTGGPSNPVETFSSDGPCRIYYGSGGAPVTPGNFSSTGGQARQKPDYAAADGVATATPGFNPFYGTSAAAPHAAAIAALVYDYRPELMNTGLVRAELLQGTALDIEAPGLDRDSGYGILEAMRAVSCLVTPPTVVSVNRWNPSDQYVSGPYVTWLVTFSKPVSSGTVRANDFTLTDVSGSITGESVATTFPQLPKTTTIRVTANTGTGAGTLRLDVLAAATINDGFFQNDYNSDYTSGQTYIVSPSIVFADTDPVGDTFGESGLQIDLTGLTVTHGRSEVALTCACSQSISPPSANMPNSVAGLIDIDSDLNPTTGSTTCLDGWAGLPDVDLGVEYTVDVGSEALHPGQVEVLAAPAFTSVGTVPITFGTNSFTFSVPRSMIGNPYGSVNLGVLLGNTDNPTDRWPNVTPPTKVASVLDMGNDTPVWLSGSVITASFDDCFYIEAGDRSAGIKVLWPAPPAAGTTVGVSGVAVTTDGPERAVQAAKVTPGEAQTLGPLFMSGRSLGGWHNTQFGFPDFKGLYNVGLLVRVAGQVSYLHTGGLFAYIDDGSGLNDGNSLGPGSTTVPGVRVLLPVGYSIPAPPGFATVTGILTTAPGPVRLLRAVE